MTGIDLEIAAAARRHAATLPRSSRVIRAVWLHEYIMKLAPKSSLLHLKYLSVVTASGEGCCYVDEPWTLPSRAIGRDALQPTGSRVFDLACMDSILRSAPRSPSGTFTLQGDPSEKATARAEIVDAVVTKVASEVGERSGGRPRVLMVGVVGDILALLSRRFEVVATDYAPHIVGEVIHGVQVYSGARTLELLRNCDVALVTGMTMANGTFDEIALEARAADTRVVMYCQTGGSFAPVLLRGGVAAVVSEFAPFYLSPDGPSVIEVLN